MIRIPILPPTSASKGHFRELRSVATFQHNGGQLVDCRYSRKPSQHVFPNQDELRLTHCFRIRSRTSSDLCRRVGSKGPVEGHGRQGCGQAATNLNLQSTDLSISVGFEVRVQAFGCIGLRVWQEHDVSTCALWLLRESHIAEYVPNAATAIRDIVEALFFVSLSWHSTCIHMYKHMCMYTCICRYIYVYTHLYVCVQRP